MLPITLHRPQPFDWIPGPGDPNSPYHSCARWASSKSCSDVLFIWFSGLAFAYWLRLSAKSLLQSCLRPGCEWGKRPWPPALLPISPSWLSSCLLLARIVPNACTLHANSCRACAQAQPGRARFLSLQPARACCCEAERHVADSVTRMDTLCVPARKAAGGAGGAACS